MLAWLTFPGGKERAVHQGALKVGELARRTGVSVRTLHWYDEIGLLSPSCHTESGHRLYGPADVARLQQIVSLRELGLSLEEIRDCLGRADFSPLRVIELHLARLREQLALQQRLCQRLETIATALRAAEEVSVEEFLQTIEVTNMIENYYTPEQLEQLARRREQVGEERIREVEAEWPRLIEEVRTEMVSGTDPADPRVQELMRRWTGLVNEFTGGDPGILQSVTNLWKNEGPALAQQHGYNFDPALFEYVNKAMAAAKKD
jgi:DNA-binding transcriptional MerR regulator